MLRVSPSYSSHIFDLADCSTQSGPAAEASANLRLIVVDVHYPGFFEVKTRGFAQTWLVMENDMIMLSFFGCPIFKQTHVKTPWVSRIPVSSILQVIPFFSAPRILKAARLVQNKTRQM